MIAAALLVAAVMAAAHHRGLSMNTAKEKAMFRVKHAVAAAVAWGSAAVPGAGQTLPPPRPATIGVNLAEIRYYSSTAPFANLAIGSEWNDTGWRHLTEEHQDKDGNLLSVPADGKVTRFLLVPPTRPEGFDARCTFTGAGTLDVQGIGRPAKAGPHSVSFHLVNERGKQTFPWLVVTGFDPAHPLRDLDCRDVRVDRAARFRPEALRPLRDFRVIRFMDWQNANMNGAISWRDRHVPGALRVDRDGVSIEDMLALVRELDVDPWFVMPWNADDDYITRFAQIVRAQLPAGRSVYVEVGNEVWNGGFPVAQQAIKEGVARGLSTNPGEAGLRRYAQRTAEVMRLWEAGFAGRSSLVRVLATQHEVPWTAETALGFADVASHVDALATAPYFGTTVNGTGNTRESGLAVMEKALPATLEAVTANRRVAAAHGKRYIGYEGGPSLALPAQKDLLALIQHDQALYGLTQRLLTGWARDGGDVLCLFNSVSRSSEWGMWGLAAWENETPAEAPKLRAARDFIVQHRQATARTPIAR